MAVLYGNRLDPVQKAVKAVYYVRQGGARIQRGVDALALNEEEKFAVIAEAMWAEVNPGEVLPKLKEAARHLIPPGWEVKYAIFARHIKGEAPADLYHVQALIQTRISPRRRFKSLYLRLGKTTASL
ncbi:hypothetical protein [Pyrobaculum aerophilum]|uniref:hypothetical protein n=1 Tax=Pyrobaculum aerophilum TaxID=13773 RepID=UPI0023F36BC9|nr:hypothetical protein [Pyrobaculum aerophilum]MCX8136981.1 hypothetical protein [Pyrobaculum aerophilum]